MNKNTTDPYELREKSSGYCFARGPVENEIFYTKNEAKALLLEMFQSKRVTTENMLDLLEKIDKSDLPLEKESVRDILFRNMLLALKSLNEAFMEMRKNGEGDVAFVVIGNSNHGHVIGMNSIFSKPIYSKGAGIAYAEKLKERKTINSTQFKKLMEQIQNSNLPVIALEQPSLN